jgi:hypothetical protein
MAKSVSITVHPSDLSGEYLTVSDAMRQVLDMIGTLEGIEAGDDSERKIVWRLTEAHTNSPPFTITAEAFAKDPQVSVAMEVDRVTKLYSVAINSVLAGERPDWLESDAGNQLRRALKRNLNGIGHTDVVIGDDEPIIIVPTKARVGLAALEAYDEEVETDLQRTEYGSVEGSVIGLTKYYNTPALVFEERSSGNKVVCVLSPDLAQIIGPSHQWAEAWEGEQLRIGGKLIYSKDGRLKRINATYHEEIHWADIPISKLQGIDVLQGRTVQEHIAEFWGERLG